jgi:DNA-binding IclR family transcriptional regulator
MARNGEKTSDKTLRILEIIGQGAAGATGKEVAEATDLPESTAYRLLRFLTECGYARKVESRYLLGAEMIRLGALAVEQNPLRAVARPYLFALVEATNETAHLGERRGDHVVYIDKIEGKRALRLGSTIGAQCPMHCTGIGKALWAFLPAREREELLNVVAYEIFTPRTIASAEAMRKELAKIAKRGYAIDDVEHEEGVYCLAAPILNRAGVAVAAISIAGAETYIRGRAKEYAARLGETAAQIATAAGLRGLSSSR